MELKTRSTKSLALSFPFRRTLESKMISHRPDQIYLLCILCTLLMLTTSVINIVYIVRRTISQPDDVSIQTATFYLEGKNRSQAESRLPWRKNDPFQQTYQTFLNSFIQNYVSISENQSLAINYCQPIPPNLQGPVRIEELPTNFSISTNSSFFPGVQPGGHYHPTNCTARHKVALIVPYRNRFDILQKFLFHTHPILQRQQLEYQIYVCEQAFNNTFNKGIVMNGCFKEILKLQPDTPCFIMHDVDLLLIDDRNMYTCPRVPRHLSVAIDKFQFYLPYKELVGGVLGKRSRSIRFDGRREQDKSRTFFAVV